MESEVGQLVPRLFECVCVYNQQAFGEMRPRKLKLLVNSKIFQDEGFCYGQTRRVCFML